MDTSFKLSDYISMSRNLKKEYCNVLAGQEQGSYQKLKIFILKSYTCDTIEPILNCILYKRGYAGDIKLGEFNQFYQEALAPDSGLYKFSPDVVLLLIRPEDFYPVVFEGDERDEAVVNSHIQKIINDINNLVSTVRKRLDGVKIIAGNFFRPYTAPFGIYEWQSQNGINNIIRRLNLGLSESLQNLDGVYILDLEEIISQKGEKAFDVKMWGIAKNPYTFKLYEDMAVWVVKIIEAFNGKRKKCIVLDLDNTLWKGIVGEDGFSGIKIHREFQKQLLFLRRTGVLLAINSKNNLDDAMNVIKNHEDMVLREEHFSDIQINWDDKAVNFRKIAKNLNLGLDSMLFIDDNPYECKLIEEILPEVSVLLLPSDYSKYVSALKDVWGLDYLALTGEDKERALLYRRKRETDRLKEGSADLDSFYRGLEMKLLITEITPDNISRYIKRISQLTQKTNQFNLTTKRYSEDDISGLIGRGCTLYIASLEDRFGEYGIIGVVIISPEQENEWEIDTFLLSCRVMERTVEQAIIYYIIKEAEKNGIKKVKGQYIETQKNKPVKDLYPKSGFKETGENRYEFDMRRHNEINSSQYIILWEGQDAK